MTLRNGEEKSKSGKKFFSKINPTPLAALFEGEIR